MATGVINVAFALDDEPANLAEELDIVGVERGSTLSWLARKLRAASFGHRGSKLSVRVDSSTSGSTDEPLDQASLTNTITQASLVDSTDTLTFGGVVTLTWKTSPSGEDEVDIGSTDTEAGDNLVTKINAHSKLGKIFVASNASGVVTITFKGDPRLGAIIAITEAGSGQVLSAGNFALDTTEAASSDAYFFNDGGLP